MSWLGSGWEWVKAEEGQRIGEEVRAGGGWLQGRLGWGRRCRRGGWGWIGGGIEGVVYLFLILCYLF